MKNLLNLFKKPKIKMIFILTILLFAYTTVCAISYAQNISTDIANSVLDYMLLQTVILLKIKI